MGQRFQVVLITPKEYWNEGNINNKEGMILVYHFQWLWGDFAIWRLGNLVKGLRKLIKQESKRTTYPIDFERLADNVLKWVCYKKLDSQNSCSPYYSDEKDLQKALENKDLKELINTFDNNNGVFILKIDGNYTFKYAFYNPKGNESSEIRQEKLIDYKEYLKDYSKDSKNYGWVAKTKEYKSNIQLFESVALLEKLPDVNRIITKPIDIN